MQDISNIQQPPAGFMEQHAILLRGPDSQELLTFSDGYSLVGKSSGKI